MNELNDQELLRDYVQNGSEAAFAGLVRRHIDLVYSTALRLVVDPHLAEDVTQAVFVAFAKAASKLAHCLVLSSWLHRTTRNLAAMTVRSEVRRRAREKQAAIMNEDSSETEAIWEKLAPQLDDALAQLPVRDRNALLLRYFERKTAREIGQRLGWSEAATQKRLVRALEQLHRTFVRRGVSVTAAALAAALSVGAVQSAPPALAATVTATALATLASSSTSGLLTLMVSTKLKFALAALVTAGLTTVLTMEHQTNGRLRAELAARNAQPIQPERQPQPLSANTVDADELTALRKEHAELLRLRGELTLLRQHERERLAAESHREPADKPPKSGGDFVPSDKWQDVGADTPQNAFQSFLAALKTGDLSRIESTIHWDLRWKDDVSDEDRGLVEKSKKDYLEMLQRAPNKLSAFNLAPTPPGAADRTRVFFHILTTEGTELASSFEMIQSDGQWKPVLSMGWRFPKEPSSFFTTPVFGPAIDLDR